MNRQVVQESSLLTTISLTKTFTIASLPTFLGTCMSQRTPIRYVAPISLFQPDRGTRFIPIHSLHIFVFLERISNVDGFGY